MNILRYSLGEMQANCYLLINGHDCLIVDPADSAEFILEEVMRRNLTPLAILATHGHFDHLLAAGEIQMSFPVPLHIFEEDMFLVKRLKESASRFLSMPTLVIEPTNIQYLKTGKMKIGPFDFEVDRAPGHSPGGATFYFKDHNALLVGDTIFQGTVGRYDFAYSDVKQLKDSLAKITAYPPVTTLYCGHGEETTVEAEKQWRWEDVLPG